MVFLNCDTAVLIHFLERLGLASRSRGGLETFFGTSRLVSVLKVERLGLVSVLRVQRLSLEFEKMERLGLVSVLKVDRLGLVSVL